MRKLSLPVAVIGGAGFLGTHLVNHLIDDRGCEVLVVDNLVAGRRDWVHPKAIFVHHDITGSEEFLRKLFQKHSIGYVFNLAAWPYVVDSFSRPLHVFNINCMGAIKVINAAQEAGCTGILQASSAELYGHAGGSEREKDFLRCGIDELFSVNPHSSYGAAKAAVDAYCQVAWMERKTPVIALRQFNCVGERETHPYVIPEIISQLSRLPNSYKDGMRIHEEAIVHLGNNSERDFMYARDAVEIAAQLMEQGSFGQVYNLGSGTSISIYQLAEKIGGLMGFKKVIVEKDEARCRPWEIWHLQSNNDKLYAALYGPRWGDRDNPATAFEKGTLNSLDNALKLTINWYENNGRRWPWEVAR
jgi:nucleoside-diphosphate-sugar epimerase